jgi:hypothetical protein
MTTISSATTGSTPSCADGGTSPALTGSIPRIRGSPRPAGAGAPTEGWFNRLQLTPTGASENSCSKKIVASISQLQDPLVAVFVRLRSKQGMPEDLILDFDATDDPIHGDQLSRFFHVYYKNYCHRPLYASSDGWPLLALLRSSNIDASSGTVQHLAAATLIQREVSRSIGSPWPDSAHVDELNLSGLRGAQLVQHDRYMRWW